MRWFTRPILSSSFYIRWLTRPVVSQLMSRRDIKTLTVPWHFALLLTVPSCSLCRSSPQASTTPFHCRANQYNPHLFLLHTSALCSHSWSLNPIYYLPVMIVSLWRLDTQPEARCHGKGIHRRNKCHGWCRVVTYRTVWKRVPQESVCCITIRTVYNTVRVKSKVKLSPERSWRSIGVFPIRYEHKLHIKSKAIPVTSRVKRNKVFLLKSWETQNFITIKTSWNTND
jgi:hypothetical protein